MNQLRKTLKYISFTKYGFKFSDISLKNTKKIKQTVKTDFVLKNEDNSNQNQENLLNISSHTNNKISDNINLTEKEKEEIENVKISCKKYFKNIR